MRTKEDVAEEQEVMPLTAFGKVCYDLTHSERVMDDLTFGRRVGLYELRGEIGSGNFSRVRYGIHALTKGEMLGLFTPNTLCIICFVLNFSVMQYSVNRYNLHVGNDEILTSFIQLFYFKHCELIICLALTFDE